MVAVMWGIQWLVPVVSKVLRQLEYIQYEHPFRLGNAQEHLKNSDG